MIDFNAIAAFVAVADAGTFSGGAREIGIPKGSISRRISRLEKELGVRLFHRTTRKVTLTDIGQAYYLRCRHGFDELAAANQLVSETVARPKGVLRIAAPAAFGRGVFADWVNTYLKLYRDTKVELLLGDDFVDLIEQRVDLAFRFGQLQDSSLIARKLATTRRILCASPEYLVSRGEPAIAEELAQHDAIVHSATLANDAWRLVDENGVEARAPITPRLSGQSLDIVLNAALAGLGIALVPEAPVQGHLANGRLKRVLERYATPSQGLFAVYSSSRQLSINVRSFLALVDEGSLLNS